MTEALKEQEKDSQKQENSKKPKPKKRFLIPVLILLGIGAAFIGWEMYHYESTDDAYVETTTVDVAPKVSGEITDVYVEDNQFVKAGEVVAQIEKNDYEIKLAQAKSRYERALLNQQNAKANHKAAQSKIELAKTDLARYKQLYADGAVSKQEFDNAQTNYDAVNANLVNAEQAVMSNSNRKVADAEINELKALMEQAELYLSYTKIYAPIDGTVSSKRVEKGMYVQPGTALFTIVPPKTWIVANFKENQLENIHEGQEVDIKIDTYPHHIFKGKVDSIQMASGAKSSMFPPENAVGSFVKIVQRVPVKIVFTGSIDPGKFKIIPGMSVVPKVHIR